ncbi:MAG: toxin-antitoxin system HicB family antitoxin [Chitinivibrionales bacterium]
MGFAQNGPVLAGLAQSHEDALHGIREVVADVVLEMQSAGKTVPEPLFSKKYSGKFRVRVPPEVPRKLAMEAAESVVSLNRLESAKLAY